MPLGVRFGDLETRFLNISPKSPAFWVRYIDDIFGIWQHDLASLTQFHHALNQFHSTIKFSLDHTGDSPSLRFLNTSVSITQDGTISTELYIKPTHSGILLHYDSAHPTSTKNAMAYSQISRAIWVSSTQAGGRRGAKKVVRMLERNGTLHLPS